ncbi:MAG TPA: hypothetical protein VMA36_04625 [Candidatus Limnocylindria bacterium]|nr:hypothetical protein [Candidatus Limnocylindria bacterium]
MGSITKKPTSSSLKRQLHHGCALARTSRTEEALVVLEDVFAVAERSNERVLAAEALDWLFWCAQAELDGRGVQRCAERMLALPISATSPQAFRLYVRHAVAALQLGDAAGALNIIERAERVSREADIEAFTCYLSAKADTLAALGRDVPALEYARLSADICSKRSDPFAHWQRTLYLGYTLQAGGQLGAALDAYLAAATIASDASLVWEQALVTALAAWIAFLVGDVVQALALLAAARASSARQPCLRVACAWISLRIGISVGDDQLIASGADAHLLDVVLSSADTYAVGLAVTTFHDYHRSRGNDAEADRLLRIGADRLASLASGWALLAPIARYGDDAMVAKAEALLESFPRDHRVARAYRRLFAALRAKRDGSTALGERLAGEAQLLFEDFSNAFEAAQCLELSGRVAEAHQRFSALKMHGEIARLRSLRARRGRPRNGYDAIQQCREIKGMLAQGATIKVIAERLGVSDRTVKARVADIYVDEGVTTRAALLERIRSRTRKAPDLIAR